MWERVGYSLSQPTAVVCISIGSSTVESGQNSVEIEFGYFLSKCDMSIIRFVNEEVELFVDGLGTGMDHVCRQLSQARKTVWHCHVYSL